MLGLLGEEEDISLGHTHLEVPSGYPQVKHKCQDEQGAPGLKQTKQSFIQRCWLMLWKTEVKGLNLREHLLQKARDKQKKREGEKGEHKVPFERDFTCFTSLRD